MRSGVLLGVLALALVDPSRADACSCVGVPIHRADPQDGATAVPLNQALAIVGAFVPSSVKLRNERGEDVPFELNAGPWPGCPGNSADVVPRAPLQPNTRYTLQVDAMYPDVETPPRPTGAIAFTTGTSMLPEMSLAPPRLTASVLRDGSPAMCGVGNTTYACLGTQDTDDVELIARRGEEVLLRTTTLVQNDGLYGLPEVPECIELRRRAPTGKRSEPTVICDDALRTRAWTKADEVDGVIQCEDGTIGAASEPSGGEDGCALASDTTAAAWLSALALLLARRRRSRGR